MDMTERPVCCIDTVGCTYLYPDSIDRILSISIRVMSGLLEFYPISIVMITDYNIMELTYHDIDRSSTTIAISVYRDIDIAIRGTVPVYRTRVSISRYRDMMILP